MATMTRADVVGRNEDVVPDTVADLAEVGTEDVGTETEVGISVVMGRKRWLVVPIRWRGLATHNVVALFHDLTEASHAARRLAAVPSAVSAAVVVPVDRGAALSVVVGVHTAQRDVADEAAVSLRRSGAKRVVRFPHGAATRPG